MPWRRHPVVRRAMPADAVPAHAVSVHGVAYDCRAFEDAHPGGTALFESHHLEIGRASAESVEGCAF